MDRIRVELAHGHDLFDLGDADFAAGGGGHVEIACGLAEYDIAGLVRLPGLHDRQIGEDAAFEDVILFVAIGPREALDLLALGHLRADAGLRIEAGNARAARAHSLGKRALGTKFDLELARKKLTLELLVLADIGADHLRHLLGAQQHADAFIVDSGIVAGEGQVLDARIADRDQQAFGNAAQAEAPAGDQHAVFQHAIEGGGGIRVKLVHRTSVTARRFRAMAGRCHPCAKCADRASYAAGCCASCNYECSFRTCTIFAASAYRSCLFRHPLPRLNSPVGSPAGLFSCSACVAGSFRGPCTPFAHLHREGPVPTCPASDTD